MRLQKKILFGLLMVVIAIQFIRPARNESDEVLPTDITKTVPVPDPVMHLLQKACYDCHSNHTRYPWYINIQPMAWIMEQHIKEGKANLNFSDFGSYSPRKRANKLKSVANSIEEGSMPISSYTMMHTDAKLNGAEKDLLMQWATKTRDSLLSKN